MTIEQLPQLYNHEAEQILLWKLTVFPYDLPDISQRITADSFHMPANKVVWEAMQRLNAQGKPWQDLVLLWEETKAKIGDYVLGLESGGDGSVGHYADLVADYATRRALVDMSSKVATAAYDIDNDVQNVVALANEQVAAVTRTSSTGGDDESIGDVADEVLETLDDAKHGAYPQSWSFPLKELAELQMYSGVYTIVGARPGVGKTAMATDMAMHDATNKERVHLFNLEMTPAQLVRRMGGQVAGISYEKLFPTRISPYSLSTEEWQRLNTAVEWIKSLPITITSNRRDIGTIAAKVRRMADEGVKRFYLDYVQLVTAPHLPKANNLERLEHVSSTIQGLCQQLDISIVAMAQLNRESEKRGDRRPELIDLSGADAFARDAGMVVFLHRPKIDDPFGGTTPAVTQAEMIVGKNRFGQSDIIKQFGWFGRYGRFVSVSK